MSESKCSACIRECEFGRSFCGRRDANGNLRHPRRLCAVSTGMLYSKPIIHFTENVRVLSVGSWGCNFRCLGCQNSSMSCTSTGGSLGWQDMNADDVIGLAHENRCRGVCYTYNEPAILAEAVETLAAKARASSLFNVLVTNCTSSPTSVRRLAPLMDVVAADIKSMDDEFYYDYCGAAGIDSVADKVLSCIRMFHELGCHVEVRTNIIDQGNDQDLNLQRISRWIRVNLGASTPWHITRFFPAHRLANLPMTPLKSLLRAQRIGLDEGLRHVHCFFSQGCDCATDSCMIDGVRDLSRAATGCCS